MMAGNIFRYADNLNMPIPNTMTMYFMKKYHGENVIVNGDELSLHYHTFFWSDYDQDGIFYWNESKTFMECFDDFNFTLAQFLLEEQVFPVSFRSGWHYMDNDWQHYLDHYILPYSMHNDYPSKKTEDPEPIDNVIDWSQAPSEFVPYHPDPDNYQIPGDGRGWNVRSAHFSTVRYRDLMEQIFSEAAAGQDQLACLWGHLPETDFLSNIEIMDSLAHKMADKYPDVNFRYCTAIEAMQLYRQNQDNSAPNITFTEERNGDQVQFLISSNEQIFQDQPFVAVKDKSENYFVVPCISTGTNSWKTAESYPVNNLVKAGVTVCDSMGNQAMQFISYLPDDIYLDDEDAGYQELLGSWTETSNSAWGTTARTLQLTENDSVAVNWSVTIPQSTHYNIFIQEPSIDNRAALLNFNIRLNNSVVQTVSLDEVIPDKEWYYLGTIDASEGDELSIEMSASGKDQAGKNIAADVLKISAIVRERDLVLSESNVDFGTISIDDTSNYELEILNHGIEPLNISTISSMNNQVQFNATYPLIIAPMSKILIPLSVYPKELGSLNDTLLISSDDPYKPQVKIPVTAEVQTYFKALDNEDTGNYSESGTWYYSNAEAYGPTSRYASLNSNPRAQASFHLTITRAGLYEIAEIVPTTVNATDDALYEIVINGNLSASYNLNQNEGSGSWVVIDSLNIPQNAEVELKVSDTGNSTVGVVLRADAVRFKWISEMTGIEDFEDSGLITEFQLKPNYPNPFNPATKIEFQLPFYSKVKIEIFNVLGKKVKTLVDGSFEAGTHDLEWDATDNNGTKVASGCYYYRIEAGDFVETRKMIYLR